MAAEAHDPLLTRRRRTVYITEELEVRLQLHADGTGRSWNNALCFVLDEALPPLVGEGRRAALNSRRAPDAQAARPVAVPTRCPACGDDVFFRTLPGSRWECDACEKGGTY